MKNVMIILVVLAVVGNVWAGTPGVDYSFGEWAADTGLSINATHADAQTVGITNLDGLANYTDLQILYLSENPITSLEAKDFVNLNNLTDLILSKTNIINIEAGVFSGKQNLYRFYLNDNIPLENKTLNWSQAHFRDLTFLTIKQLDITTVDLSYSELSQEAFYYMMNGGGAAFIGMAELGSIATMNFDGANLTDVTSFGAMYGMTNLQTLNLANISFSGDVISSNFQEVVQLVNALEQQGILSFLTIDNALYTGRQSYFDDWDSLPLNELTIVPEPNTLTLLSIGILAFLRKRK
jgi:Leucine-rich repeat (LRR) protein